MRACQQVHRLTKSSLTEWNIGELSPHQIQSQNKLLDFDPCNLNLERVGFFECGPSRVNFLILCLSKNEQIPAAES